QLADHAADQADGDEHGGGGDGRRGDRAGDLAHGVEDRGAAILAVGQVPVDVLDDDDRVVDDAPDGHRQRGQGEQVERDPDDLEADERDDERQRDRHGGHRGGPDLAQEQQDDDDGEHQAEQALDREVLDRLLDERRLVEDDDDL